MYGWKATFSWKILIFIFNDFCVFKIFIEVSSSIEVYHLFALDISEHGKVKISTQLIY